MRAVCRFLTSSSAVHVAVSNVRLKSESAASSIFSRIVPPHSKYPQNPDDGMFWAG